ncbi:ATP-binding protein [Kangiella sp.]|uniref:ATP-binding protein n=1 Tax=Kangiella sp. TaxID=1920245 RepID=UPI003A93BC4B
MQIRYKQFLVILVANLLLAAALFTAVSWNFNRSFRDYVRNDQAKELQPFVEGLAEAFQHNGNQWLWLQNNRRQWQRLVQQYLIQNSDPQSRLTESPQPTTRPLRMPRPPHPMTQRLLLSDAQGNPIIDLPSINPEHRKPSIQWLPIKVEGELVGQLGVAHSTELEREMDRLFVTHQLQQLAWIVLGILLISVGLAFPFAKRLVRPVTRLQESMQQLAGGNIEQLEPLPVISDDELGRLAHAFNLLTDTLKDNLKSRQQWIADISHELRTPVAILQGELEALIDGVRPLQPSSLESLHAEVGRLTRLINDLYELALSDQGALAYHREELSLNILLSDFVEESEPRLLEKDIQLDFQASKHPLILFADESRLIQLFRNLLNNSLRYTNAGGQLRVRLLEDRQKGMVTVLWEDSHPGVADKDLERLFERLYRTDSARDRISGGVGLGLAICQAIVEGHQGWIEASHSELGGLAIAVHLPLYR